MLDWNDGLPCKNMSSNFTKKEPVCDEFMPSVNNWEAHIPCIYSIYMYSQIVKSFIDHLLVIVWSKYILTNPLPFTISACHVSISMSPENLSWSGARVGALMGVNIPSVLSSE